MAALVYRMLQGGDTFIYLTSEPAPSFTLLVSWMKETDIRFNPGFLFRDVCRSWGKFRFHSDRPICSSTTLCLLILEFIMSSLLPSWNSQWENVFRMPGLTLY
jgi:hypothetical protein